MVSLSEQQPPAAGGITRWLNAQPAWARTLWTGSLAFLVYACMYGLRKPFTVASFEGYTFLGADLKVWLIIAQVFGYALSKFAGISVISGMKAGKRALYIVLLNGLAFAALVAFALVPPPWNIVFLFLNGIPLGLIWGLVFSYLEGRRTTEILGTVLSISFIVSSGLVKSAGKFLMERLDLTDFQMPWVTGLAFLLPMVLLTWLLDQTPPPDAEDVRLRTLRVPMNGASRMKLFRKFAPGIVLLTGAYIILTVYRDLRDNFSAEIWASIGYSGNAMIFTWSELPAAAIVLAAMASTMRIRDNMKAFMVNHWLIIAGFTIIALAALAVQASLISPAVWMVLVGLGLFMGYLPFNSLIFDRMIAAYGTPANAGFLIYIADSFGYLGSISALLYKNFGSRDTAWADFLMGTSFFFALPGIALMTFSMLFFRSRYQLQSGKKIDLAAA